MKKTLLSILVIGTVVSTRAQTIFSENFNSEDITGWTLYDEDGDENDWRAVQFVDDNDEPSGTPVLASYSWLGSPLTPDNWAVTPAISLAGQNGSLPITLSWKVTGVDPDYSAENYSVYVATANTVEALSESTTFLNEVVTDNGVGGLDTFYVKTIDITSFAGQTIYVGFRHHNVSDEFAIAIDDVMVYAGEAPVSVQEIPTINGFSHFYNVQANTLHLSATQEFSRIAVYSVIGQEMINQKLYNTNEVIDLSRLSTGVYFFNIESQGQKTTLKIAVK
jgi:hypothetical protein